MAITHLVVSLLLIHLLTLDRNDSFVALMFGVFIDVDHLFGLRGYVEAHGLSGVLDFDSLMQADGQWKSLLHSPVAAMVVGPVSVGSRLAIPLVFWGVHMAMDYLEDTWLGVFSAWEMALLAGSSIAFTAVCFRTFRMKHPESGFTVFLRSVLSWLGSPWRSLVSAAFGPRGQ